MKVSIVSCKQYHAMPPRGELLEKYNNGPILSLRMSNRFHLMDRPLGFKEWTLVSFVFRQWWALNLYFRLLPLMQSICSAMAGWRLLKDIQTIFNLCGVKTRLPSTPPLYLTNQHTTTPLPAPGRTQTHHPPISSLGWFSATVNPIG